jgi:hypothetical protein
MDKQLSFENLGQNSPAGRTGQTGPAKASPVPNATVPAAIAPRLKHQAQAIYSALKRGPLWTNDLRAMAAQYNARLKEIREMLRKSGMTIDVTAKGRDGNNRYALRPFAGSRYQAERMARQKKNSSKDPKAQNQVLSDS